MKQDVLDKLMQDIGSAIIDVSKRQHSDFTNENLLLKVCCENPGKYPREIAELYNKIQEERESSEFIDHNKVIQKFKRFKIRYPLSNEKQLTDIFGMAEVVSDFLAGKQYSPNLLNDISSNLDNHIQKKRLVFLLVVNYNSFIMQDTSIYKAAMRMNKDFAGECLDDILGLIHHHFHSFKNKKNIQVLSAEEYQREIDRLETSLNRANKLLVRLQDSFAEQLEDSKMEEQVRFMSMLNSEKYGFILDLLISAQSGFREIKKRQEKIPFEIKSMQTLVRRLLEFVEDCEITQILELGEQMQVKASDLEGYSFDGKPFLNEEELKTVEVISPGWEIVSRDIIISYPRVRELNEEV